MATVNVRLVNRKCCYEALSKKIDLRKINNSSNIFQPDVKLYFIENRGQKTNIWDANAECSEELASYKAPGALEKLSKSDVK